MSKLQLLAWNFFITCRVYYLFRIESGYFFSRYRNSIQSLWTSRSYIFHILQHFETRICSFTHFKVLHLAALLSSTLSREQNWVYSFNHPSDIKWVSTFCSYYISWANNKQWNITKRCFSYEVTLLCIESDICWWLRKIVWRQMFTAEFETSTSKQCGVLQHINIDHV